MRWKLIRGLAQSLGTDAGHMSQDTWCKHLPTATLNLPDLQLKEFLWYIGNRLIIPHTGNLHEILFQLAHDTLGHFGFNKTYGTWKTDTYLPALIANVTNHQL